MDVLERSSYALVWSPLADTASDSGHQHAGEEKGSGEGKKTTQKYEKWREMIISLSATSLTA